MKPKTSVPAKIVSDKPLCVVIFNEDQPSGPKIGELLLEKADRSASLSHIRERVASVIFVEPPEERLFGFSMISNNGCFRHIGVKEECELSFSKIWPKHSCHAIRSCDVGENSAERQKGNYKNAEIIHHSKCPKTMLYHEKRVHLVCHAAVIYVHFALPNLLGLAPEISADQPKIIPPAKVLMHVEDQSQPICSMDTNVENELEYAKNTVLADLRASLATPSLAANGYVFLKRTRKQWEEISLDQEHTITVADVRLRKPKGLKGSLEPPNSIGIMMRTSRQVDMSAMGFSELALALQESHKTGGSAIDVVKRFMVQGVGPQLDWRGQNELHYAFSFGMAELVPVFIDAVAPSNAWLSALKYQDTSGKTPLHCALYNNHVNIALSVVKRFGYAVSGAMLEDTMGNASVNLLKKDLPTIWDLVESQSISNLESSLSLMTQHVLIIPNVLGRNAFHEALSLPIASCNEYKEDAKKVLQILLSKCSQTFVSSIMSRQDSTGQTPLHYICSRGWMDGLKAVLQHCVPTTLSSLFALTDNSGRTPLHIALQYNHTDIVLYIRHCILQSDQNSTKWRGILEMKDSNGDSVSQLLDGVDQLVDLVRKNDVDAVDRRINSELENWGILSYDGGPAISSESKQEIWEKIFSADCMGRTILHEAVETNSVDVCAVLLRCSEYLDEEKCADKLLKAADWRGQSALHYACIRGYSSIVSLLLSKEISILYQIDNQGKTAFHHALYGSHNEIVKYLLLQLENESEKNSPLCIGDDNGFTPLHVAAYFGNDEAYSWLIEKQNLSGKSAVNAVVLTSGELSTAVTTEGEYQSSRGKHKHVGAAWTPLTCALMSGNIDIINNLLQHSAVSPAYCALSLGCWVTSSKKYKESQSTQSGDTTSILSELTLSKALKLFDHKQNQTQKISRLLNALKSGHNKNSPFYIVKCTAESVIGERLSWPATFNLIDDETLGTVLHDVCIYCSPVAISSLLSFASHLMGSDLTLKWMGRRDHFCSAISRAGIRGQFDVFQVILDHLSAYNDADTVILTLLDLVDLGDVKKGDIYSYVSRSLYMDTILGINKHTFGQTGTCSYLDRGDRFNDSDDDDASDLSTDEESLVEMDEVNGDIHNIKQTMNMSKNCVELWTPIVMNTLVYIAASNHIQLFGSLVTKLNVLMNSERDQECKALKASYVSKFSNINSVVSVAMDIALVHAAYMGSVRMFKKILEEYHGNNNLSGGFLRFPSYFALLWGIENVFAGLKDKTKSPSSEFYEIAWIIAHLVKTVEGPEECTGMSESEQVRFLLWKDDILMLAGRSGHWPIATAILQAGGINPVGLPLRSQARKGEKVSETYENFIFETKEMKKYVKLIIDLAAVGWNSIRCATIFDQISTSSGVVSYSGSGYRNSILNSVQPFPSYLHSGTDIENCLETISRGIWWLWSYVTNDYEGLSEIQSESRWNVMKSLRLLCSNGILRNPLAKAFFLLSHGAVFWPLPNGNYLPLNLHRFTSGDQISENVVNILCDIASSVNSSVRSRSPVLDSWNLLHAACLEDYVAGIKALLDAGMDPDTGLPLNQTVKCVWFIRFTQQISKYRMRKEKSQDPPKFIAIPCISPIAVNASVQLSHHDHDVCMPSSVLAIELLISEGANVNGQWVWLRSDNTVVSTSACVMAARCRNWEKLSLLARSNAAFASTDDNHFVYIARPYSFQNCVLVGNCNPLHYAVLFGAPLSVILDLLDGGVDPLYTCRFYEHLSSDANRAFSVSNTLKAHYIGNEHLQSYIALNLLQLAVVLLPFHNHVCAFHKQDSRISFIEFLVGAYRELIVPSLGEQEIGTGIPSLVLGKNVPTVNQIPLVVAAKGYISTAALICRTVQRPDDIISSKNTSQYLHYMLREAQSDSKYMTIGVADSTLLHIVCQNKVYHEGNLEIVKWLCDSGVSVLSLDSKQKTPLYYAAKSGFNEALSVMLDNIDTEDSNLHTGLDDCLKSACLHGSLDCVRIALLSWTKYRCKVTPISNDVALVYIQCMLAAVQCGDIKIVTALLTTKEAEVVMNKHTAWLDSDSNTILKSEEVSESDPWLVLVNNAVAHKHDQCAGFLISLALGTENGETDENLVATVPSHSNEIFSQATINYSVPQPEPFIVPEEVNYSLSNTQDDSINYSIPMMNDDSVHYTSPLSPDTSVNYSLPQEDCDTMKNTTPPKFKLSTISTPSFTENTHFPSVFARACWFGLVKTIKQCLKLWSEGHHVVELLYSKQEEFGFSPALLLYFAGNASKIMHELSTDLFMKQVNREIANFSGMKFKPFGWLRHSMENRIKESYYDGKELCPYVPVCDLDYFASAFSSPDSLSVLCSSCIPLEEVVKIAVSFPYTSACSDVIVKHLKLDTRPLAIDKAVLSIKNAILFHYDTLVVALMEFFARFGDVSTMVDGVMVQACRCGSTKVLSYLLSVSNVANLQAERKPVSEAWAAGQWNTVDWLLGNGFEDTREIFPKEPWVCSWNQIEVEKGNTGQINLFGIRPTGWFSSMMTKRTTTESTHTRIFDMENSTVQNAESNGWSSAVKFPSTIQEICSVGWVDALTETIAKGADVNSSAPLSFDVKKKNGAEVTPLFIAIKHRHFDVVKKLVENGASVKQTGLLAAAEKCGNSAIVDYLISLGCERDA